MLFVFIPVISAVAAPDAYNAFFSSSGFMSGSDHLLSCPIKQQRRGQNDVRPDDFATFGWKGFQITKYLPSVT
jgi:hypothetical protein